MSNSSDSTPKPAVEVGQIHLPQGLIGMSELQHFEIVVDPESRPFLLLRSLDSMALDFVAIQPHGIIPDYQLELSDEDAEELGVKSAEDRPIVINIATVRSMSPQVVTANLVAPILINRQTGVGKQVILANYQNYSTTYSLINEAP